jgi:hypothetical protein
MTTEKLVNKALFGKTELATQKIELALIDEVRNQIDNTFKFGTELETLYNVELDNEPELEAPKYYDNSNGSLYKLAYERKWNPYVYEVVKRLDRAERKGEFISDLEKTKNVIDIYLKEQGHLFNGQIEKLNK